MSALTAVEQEHLDRPAPEWAVKLIDRAQQLSTSARGPLRSQAGVSDHRQAPANAQVVFRGLVKGLALASYDWRTAWRLAVICAAHPKLHAPGGLTVPSALRRLRSSASSDRRLARTIDCDRQELLDALPGICAQVASARLHLDLYRLAWALEHWGSPARTAQHVWAADAWPANLDDPPTPDQKETS